MSLQVTGALLIFFLATVVSVHVMKSVGPKKISWLALASAMAACAMLSNAPSMSESEADPLRLGEAFEWLQKPLEGIIFYYDGAIAGYLLICISAAFLSTASF